MTLLFDLNEINERLGHLVRTKNGLILPGEEDFQLMLDKAAGDLYSEPIGATLRVGRLIVEKRPKYLDVYIHVGTYQ